jgi:hypothetical protein
MPWRVKQEDAHVADTTRVEAGPGDHDLGNRRGHRRTIRGPTGRGPLSSHPCLLIQPFGYEAGLSDVFRLGGETLPNLLLSQGIELPPHFFARFPHHQAGPFVGRRRAAAAAELYMYLALVEAGRGHISHSSPALEPLQRAVPRLTARWHPPTVSWTGSMRQKNCPIGHLVPAKRRRRGSGQSGLATASTAAILRPRPSCKRS